MITLYQELIPLSNKMYEAPISNSTYTSPVIIPFIYNSVGSESIMETVIYLRNNSQEHYYKDIVVTLMKESGTNPVDSSAVISMDNPSSPIMSLNAASGSNAINLELVNVYSPAVIGSITLQNKYKNTYIPVVEDDNVTVKFSYGYDELSFNSWAQKKSGLLIPQIGTSGGADLSYHEIRMRMTWKGTPTAFTIRDYFIDISYSTEVTI